ncbi:HD domain-containing protein [Dyadobacter psychrophilus]|uniref:HD domain-containing protein n=1 Tax=Dyadobacter psychrophilus TaxID=651661 RepID=A0A1T5EQ03_9BACT|nr:HD domain-containing protein [Dyadobacter psychrophilus]SKB85995.1 HD domain-containing protein [Dyadobacter psychrophilus]
MTNELLTKVYDFAAKAHEGQTRKYAYEDYIRHPERVMHTCAQFTSDHRLLASALLHDVLEDTEVSEAELGNFLQMVMDQSDAKQTLQYVKELTDVYIKKDYPNWNRRTRKARELERLTGISANAQTVKYADIIDNSADVAENDKNFAAVLLKEYQQILRNLTKGNPTLLSRAHEAIIDARKRLKSQI